MPILSLKTILREADQIAKQIITAAIFCPECGERYRWVKHGFYRRYLFDGEDQIAVQRYRCCNPDCPRCTFSILPYPFLRIVRLPLCVLMLLLERRENGASIARLSRAVAKGKGVVRRALHKAERIRPWLDSEGVVAAWGPDPELSPKEGWTAFIHDFSRVFYPALYR